MEHQTIGWRVICPSVPANQSIIVDCRIFSLVHQQNYDSNRGKLEIENIFADWPGFCNCSRGVGIRKPKKVKGLFWSTIFVIKSQKPLYGIEKQTNVMNTDKTEPQIKWAETRLCCLKCIQSFLFHVLWHFCLVFVWSSSQSQKLHI